MYSLVDFRRVCSEVAKNAPISFAMSVCLPVSPYVTTRQKLNRFMINLQGVSACRVRHLITMQIHPLH